MLTMFDPRNNLSHEVAGEVRRHFHVFDAIIPRNVRLSEAPSHGKPVLLYDAQSKGAQGYLSLAREVIEAERTMIPTDKRRALGRGLDALLPDMAQTPAASSTGSGSKDQVFTCPSSESSPSQGSPVSTSMTSDSRSSRNPFVSTG